MNEERRHPDIAYSWSERGSPFLDQVRAEEKNMESIWWALGGSMVTFAATAAGAAFVFFFRGDPHPAVQRFTLGLAAGIMIAALVWSLLLPAQELAGPDAWWVTTAGFLLGGLMLLILDRILPHEHPGTGTVEGIHTRLGRRTMLVLAVTLHNVPEGAAVGLTFAAAAEGVASDVLSLGGALALAAGMALQNLPEGTAVSLPLREAGMSKKAAFWYGAASGAVEPVAAVAAALLVEWITPAMPWLLSIAAGAMMYVVVEELIPEAHLGEHTHAGTFSVMIGFVLMMILEMTVG